MATNPMPAAPVDTPASTTISALAAPDPDPDNPGGFDDVDMDQLVRHLSGILGRLEQLEQIEKRQIRIERDLRDTRQENQALRQEVQALRQDNGILAQGIQELLRRTSGAPTGNGTVSGLNAQEESDLTTALLLVTEPGSGIEGRPGMPRWTNGLQQKLQQTGMTPERALAAAARASALDDQEDDDLDAAARNVRLLARFLFREARKQGTIDQDKGREVFNRVFELPGVSTLAARNETQFTDALKAARNDSREGA